MNKIAAVLRTDSYDEVDKSVDGVKFGDDDVSSKRRKNENDEYEKEFQNQLAINALNSTATFGEDFTGGLVNDDDASSLATVIQYGQCSSSTNHTITDHSNDNDDFNLSITSRPSDSSFGFENTFTILENQLHVKKQPKLNQQQIEYILLKNNDVAVKNPIYIDIPINDEWCLRSVGGYGNSSMQDTDDDECPPASLFDLKIEAMLRVKELLGDKCKTNDLKCNEIETEHIPINTSLLEDFYQQDDDECSDYVYHVAKSKDGRTYLRVVRSFLVDKGKQKLENNNIIYLEIPSIRTFVHLL